MTPYSMQRLELPQERSAHTKFATTQELLGKHRGGRPRIMAHEGRQHPNGPASKPVDGQVGQASNKPDTPQPITPLMGSGEKDPHEKVYCLPSHDEAIAAHQQWLDEGNGPPKLLLFDLNDPQLPYRTEQDKKVPLEEGTEELLCLPSHEEAEASYREWLDEREERLKGPPTDEEIIRRATRSKDPLNVDEYMELETVAQRILAEELERIENDPDMLAEDKDIARKDAHFDYGGHILPLQDRLDGIDASKLIPKPPRQLGIEVPEIPPDELPIYEASRKEMEARVAEIDAMKLPKNEKWLLKFGLLKEDELEKSLEAHRTNRDFAELVWEQEAEVEGFALEGETTEFSFDDIADEYDSGQSSAEDHEPPSYEGYDEIE